MRYVKLFLLLTVLVSGCTTAPTMRSISVSMPDGKHATIVSERHVAPNWVRSVDSFKASYIVPGTVTEVQRLAVANAEKACREHTKNEHASDGVSILGQSLLYGATGYLGVGIGAKAFGSAAKWGQYAKYGGAAGAFSGLASGFVMEAGREYTFGSCMYGLLNDTFPEFNLHVILPYPYR